MEFDRKREAASKKRQDEINKLFFGKELQHLNFKMKQEKGFYYKPKSTSATPLTNDAGSVAHQTSHLSPQDNL